MRVRRSADKVDVADHVDVVGDVGSDQSESVMAGEVRDVRRRPGREVVERDDLVPLVEQAFAEVRAEEAGAAGDDRATNRDRRHG